MRRCGKSYCRRLQRLTVLLRRLMMAVMVVSLVVMNPLADRLTAGQLLLRLMALIGVLITICRYRHQRCSEIVDFV